MPLISMRQLLDHAAEHSYGVPPAVCQRSIQLGFSSVMMDGSLEEHGKTPADYDYNVEVTRRTVDMAHACGVSVEGELGCLGSLETGEASEEDGVGAEGVLTLDQMLTDPEEAADFVNKTQVDALAIAIGTSHGTYKFSRKSTGAIRRFLAQNPAEFDPRKYLKETITAMKDICVARYEAFGTAGNADKIKVIGLEAMYQRYASGELAPKIN